MPPKSFFYYEPLVTFTRKCVVFPAQGSEPQIVDMTIRTVTTEDTRNVCSFDRTVDLLATYGSEYRKTRTVPMGYFDNYLLHYNMSPKLPLNRCIARILDIDPDASNIESELFWRGDAVAMKFESATLYSRCVNCYDTDSSAIGNLQEMLRNEYSTGILEQQLSSDEKICKRGQRIRLTQN